MHIPLWREILNDIRVDKVSSEAYSLAKKYGYRAYMVERYVNLFGYDGAKKLLKAFEKKIKPVIRCNDVRVDCKYLVERLEELGFQLKHIRWSIHGYRVIKSPKKPSIGATHEYLKGYYYVHRDSPPLIPALLLVHNRSPSTILDGCAAPGGKTTHLAQLMRGKGLVVANDVALYRLVAVLNHVLRMGFKNVVITWNDLRRLPNKLEIKFKKILLDVPCSAEGTIMFDPSRKRKTSQRDLARIIAREIQLLEAGVKLLDEKGVLVYTTCSIAPEENEYVVTKILRKYSNLRIIDPPIKLFNWSHGVTEFRDMQFHRDVYKCIRTWPHIHGTMGMTICILEKIS